MVAQGLDNSLVGALAAPIGLWVVGGKHFKFNAREFAQSLPELAHEDFVTITDDIKWQSVFAIP